MGKNILVLTRVNEEHKKLMEEKAPSAAFYYSSNRTVDKNQIQQADIIIGNPPITMVEDLDNLKWLQLDSAGVGAYASRISQLKGVILTNASGAFGLSISEYMLGVLLEIYRKLYLYRDNQRDSNWVNEGAVKSIYKSTALIVGAGDIGCEFAVRMKALGAYTIGIRRKDTQKPDFFDELYLIDQLDALLPRADIVALSLPATTLTEKIINRRTLMLMKHDAVLINVGRGTAVDTEALCDVLESGHLLGAALDVTDPEPLPREHRLWKIKNAIITPHISGGFNLQETHDRVIRICADNLEAYFSGKKLMNVVDLSAGY